MASAGNPERCVGAQIVSVPMSVPLIWRGKVCSRCSFIWSSSFSSASLVLNLVLYLTIAKPVAQLSSHGRQDQSRGTRDP